MRVWLEERFEAGLLRLAAWILNRNVQRSRVTSRHDNNRLFELTGDLRMIARRIEQRYPD